MCDTFMSTYTLFTFLFIELLQGAFQPHYIHLLTSYYSLQYFNLHMLINIIYLFLFTLYLLKSLILLFIYYYTSLLTSNTNTTLTLHINTPYQIYSINITTSIFINHTQTFIIIQKFYLSINNFISTPSSPYAPDYISHSAPLILNNLSLKSLLNDSNLIQTNNLY